MDLSIYGLLDVAFLGATVHDQAAPGGGAMSAPWGRFAGVKGGGLVGILDELCLGVGLVGGIARPFVGGLGPSGGGVGLAGSAEYPY